MKNIDISKTTEILRQAGLSEKEAQIYVGALLRGGGTISELADSIDIERTGIYYHIDKLKTLGLLRQIDRGKRKVFIPVDPVELKKTVEEKQKQFQELFPKIEELFSRQNGKSVIEYFQGKDEIHDFYDRVYYYLSKLEASNNTVHVLGASFDVVTKNTKELLRFSPPANHLNIITKAILPVSQKSNRPEGNKKDPYIITRYNLPPAEIRFINDKYSYPGAVTIFDDKIILYDYRNMIYSITQNKNMAASWKMFFEFMWDHAKE